MEKTETETKTEKDWKIFRMHQDISVERTVYFRVNKEVELEDFEKSFGWGDVNKVFSYMGEDWDVTDMDGNDCDFDDITDTGELPPYCESCDVSLQKLPRGLSLMTNGNLLHFSTKE